MNINDNSINMQLQPLVFDKIATAQPLVIAGPCSAESEEQVLSTARGLVNCGVKVFRAGIWKPRTRPGDFEGVGIKGLEWLHRVKQETGMLIATEVATREHVLAVLDAEIDILWIGARTCTNPFAMQEIADTLQAHHDVTVLVKNPVNPDVELWIGGLQRLYNAGVKRLGAIHRGFSTYGSSFYRNAPHWNIAFELHRRLPQLPILSDPSHMGGKRELIAPLSQQALDMGFNGLFIESHINPDAALSDSRQQVTPIELLAIVEGLVVRDVTQSTESLDFLRQQIDQCDHDLLETLNRRMAISREIGRFKKEHNIQIVLTQRYGDIIDKMKVHANGMGLNGDFIASIMQIIHEESVKQQINVFKQ